jgi:hypothetical protein
VPEAAAPSDPLVARVLRRAVLWILLFSAVGSLAELGLIGHYEDAWQFAPLALLGVVIAATTAYLLRATEGRRRIFIIVMWVSIAGGLAGHWLHYTGNAEFEQEMYPDRVGVELFRESMTGATPVLAPATMAVIGLLGLVATWRPRRSDR